MMKQKLYLDGQIQKNNSKIVKISPGKDLIGLFSQEYSVFSHEYSVLSQEHPICC